MSLLCIWLQRQEGLKHFEGHGQRLFCCHAKKSFQIKKSSHFTFRPVRKPRSPTKVGLPQKKPSIIPTPSPIPKPTLSTLSPERNNNDRYQVRPGTYKKSGTTPCDETDEDPTRADIMAMVEKDVAFSSLENRKLLMGFIKKICQAP